MNRFLKSALVAAALGSGALAATPASAASFRISYGFPGVGFNYDSGGYCDSWGCPDQFWDYPVYYCPVYFRGRWYRGPVYYRQTRFGVQFWIHDGWRRDMWGGPRPRGACVDR